ncbi:hypothetical protein HDU82_004469 [Entophlyctis luteolus]|nr:hypothetical protein HDU82_004469 [Entophlyctis luteolus]
MPVPVYAINPFLSLEAGAFTSPEVAAASAKAPAAVPDPALASRSRTMQLVTSGASGEGSNKDGGAACASIHAECAECAERTPATKVKLQVALNRARQQAARHGPKCVGMSPAQPAPAAAQAAAGDRNRVSSWLKTVVGGFAPSASPSATSDQALQEQQQHGAANLMRKNSSSFFASFTRASSDRSRSPSRSAMLRANSPRPPTPAPELRGRAIFSSKSSVDSKKLPSRPASGSRDREAVERAPTALSMRASPMPSSVASRAIRSSSPAPSASSTLAAERLVRLSDAQLAELASQVSAEAYRRRTPIGALLSTYERASQSQNMRTAAPTTSARIAIMTNEKFKVFAADLHSEAIRRDIPGIDIFGSRATNTSALAAGAPPVAQAIFPATSLSRSNTLTIGTSAVKANRFDGGDTLAESGTPPGSPLLSPVAIPPQLDAGNNAIPTKLLPIIAAAAVAANSSASPATVVTSPPQTPSAPSTIPRSESKQNLRDSIGTADMTPEDRVVAVDRMANLSDAEFTNLMRDVRNELNSRLTSSEAGDERTSQEGGDVEGAVRNSGGSGREDGRSTLTSGVSNGLMGTNQTQRRLIPSALSSGSTAVANSGPQLPATSSASIPQFAQVSPMQAERLSLLRRVASVDLDALWDDMQKEAARREALGIILNTADAAGSTASAAAAAAESAAESQQIHEVHSRRKLPVEDGGANGAEKAEAPNVVAWRNRIAKLTNEQLAEVTADVFDEITRRKEKKEPFLSPRDDLSAKRNDARKELSKLPSKELKTLWTIIHDNMTKRNML